MCLLSMWGIKEICSTIFSQQTSTQSFTLCRHWKKNYFDINQLPYYAYLYKKDSSVGAFAVCDQPQVSICSD